MKKNETSSWIILFFFSFWNIFSKLFSEAIGNDYPFDYT
jgi:hypothetical protein